MSDLAITTKTTGIADIDRKLAALAGREARKVVRSGVGAGLTVLANELRSQTTAANVTPRMRKALLPTIGKRFGAAKAGASKGQLQAKAGFSVGKKQPKGEDAPKRRKGSKGGVGISARNVQWPLLGTKQRQTGAKTKRTKTGSYKVSTGNPVRNTGAMPRVDPIAKRAAAAAGGKIRAAVELQSRIKLEQVVAALR